MSNETERNVPSNPVAWRAWLPSDPDRIIKVSARLWYEARRMALRLIDQSGHAVEQDVVCEAWEGEQ